MLYTSDFATAGMLAVALTLSAASSVAHRIAEEESARGQVPRRPAAPLTPNDIEALGRLSSALETHTVHEPAEPDQVIARHARAAAAAATGRAREMLVSLAESAQRSALAFLVDYSLLAGRWEAQSGLRMATPLVAQR
ncbi:hypothetical protein ACFOYW_09825 [Gryllotalpicola reticulitermitis]|uniref:DUF4439 domain-containing protein n=1 Tax=Gryllotalpicola reticulitermitis TaxID=1184153 RepID=A0ABV8Q5J1_9MICO